MGTFLAQPLTQKYTQSGQNNKIKYTLCQMQGWRRQMEDASICQVDLHDGNSLFAIFDGHAGPQVSNYVKQIFKQILLANKYYQKGQYQNALISTFKKIDEILRSDQGEESLKKLNTLRKDKQYLKKHSGQKISSFVGCAAHVVLITPLAYVVANCGDSRSILLQNDILKDMSYDHKPDGPTQFQRITTAGGRIVSGRINGKLNLSRGFGDFNFKDEKLNFDQTMVTCLPDVRFFPRSPQDQFILIGCDGIFQKFPMNTKPLSDFIAKRRKLRNKGQTILEKLFNKLLAKDINQMYGCDNMSAILIEFQ